MLGSRSNGNPAPSTALKVTPIAPFKGRPHIWAKTGIHPDGACGRRMIYG